MIFMQEKMETVERFAQALFEAGREELWIPMAYDAVRRQLPDGRLAMAGGFRPGVERRGLPSCLAADRQSFFPGRRAAYAGLSGPFRAAYGGRNHLS